MRNGAFVTGFSNFSLRLPSPIRGRKATPSDYLMIAEFRLSADASELAPYINAVADKAAYYEKPTFIRFMLDGVLCTLCQQEGSAASFSDRDEALDFLNKLIAFLNDVHRRRDSIVPDYRRCRSISVLDVFRLLPRTDCGECGFASCMAFAAALSRRRTAPDRCPGFGQPISISAVYPVFDDQGNLISTVSIDLDSHPSVSASKEAPAVVPEDPDRRRNETPKQGNSAIEFGEDPPHAPLTSRELMVLRLVAEGATNGEISDALQISPHTVKSHIIHIFNKLGVSDRTQAAVWAALHHLI